MTFACKVRGCLSDQNTKIDGREISLFAFPEDDTRRQQWIKNCRLVLNSCDGNDSLYVCELHFEKNYFTASNELKTNAIPTIFRNGEDLQRKRKAENNEQVESSKILPSKQKNLDDDSHSLVTPPQSPFTQLGENIEESNLENKTNAFKEPVNGTDPTTSTPYKEMDIGKNIYRLTIQIEKIQAEPESDTKEPVILSNQEVEDFAISNNEMLIFKDEPEMNDEPPAEKMVKISKVKKPPCIKGGCKLKKAMYGTKPAFQCEECNKYYVMKKCNAQIEKTNVCSVCQKSFASPQSLYLHVKKHFVCDMCLTECSSRMSFDKHAKSHVSTDPLFPYKCHRCFEIFDTKDEIRNHYVLMHPSIKLEGIGRAKVSPVTVQVPQQEYLCPTCNITFRNEHAYRNHVNCHTQKEGIRCNIAEPSNIISVPTPLTGGQIGILRAVTFSCRVCSKEFDNVAEVDQHTRTHLENAEEHKCNICKKMFKTSAQLNEHLKHHLSRAHPCPICPKAFINRTTLKIHLKTHGDS
ncbi:zinc finger protein 717-like [Vespa crabro]|uniref:zinc finger protein 717-like n=1 Tax=Vespa crabro TaxID=7445 RepID=UPI001F022BED|nr:zinc finger protein 717-like [Vespa crabro]